MEDIGGNFVGDDMDLDCKLEGESLEIEQDKAIYVGLLVNELLTNSIKHAFREQDQGTVWINVAYDEPYLRIDYEDDGKGLPEGFQWSGGESVGSTLISKFVDQLEGDIDLIGQEHGTHFQIRFPAAEGKHENM